MDTRTIDTIKIITFRRFGFIIVSEDLEECWFPMTGLMFIFIFYIYETYNIIILYDIIPFYTDSYSYSLQHTTKHTIHDRKQAQRY